VGGGQHHAPGPERGRPRRAHADGSVLGLPVRQGAQRAVLGADQPHDAARRGAGLPRRRRADRVGRHGPADAARGDAGAGEHVDDPAHPDGVRDGQALALLQAVGGFQAFRRAVPAPANAGPVARFLLYERAYPDSVAASVDAVQGALVDADAAPRSSEPVLRLSRLAADLEFRGRAAAKDGNLADACGLVQAELALVDADIAERYFAGAAVSVGTVLA
jgi:hypothetical protein